MKRFFPVTLFLLSCSFIASAQSLPDMAIPVDASSVAMGVMASGNAAFAADGNTSAAVFVPKSVNVGVSAINWAPDGTFVRSGCAGATFRTSRVGIVLGARLNEGQPYTAYNSNWQPVGEFQPCNVFISAGAAVRITEHLALGATGRYVSSSIGQDCNATAFSGDISITWQGRAFQASASVCNMGTPVRYVENGTMGILPRMARAGAHADLWGCLRIGGELDCVLNDGNIMFTAGAQYSLMDVFFLRAGYHYGNSAAVIPEYATVGAAIRIRGVELGAAWLTASEILGNSFLFSLTISI